MSAHPVSAEQPWSFIVTGDSRGLDSGINRTILSELADEATRQRADFVMFLGDLVYGRSQMTPAEFEAQLRTWVDTMLPVYDANIPIYVCRGNHEVGDTWGTSPAPEIDPDDNYATRWLEVFGSDTWPDQRLPDNGPPGETHMTYSVTHKNAFILVLDQYSGIRHRADHRVNQQWLDLQLKGNTKPHIFVGGHEQAFRALHADCLDNHPVERDTFWASLRNAGARLYFCGHDHFYDHARVIDGDGYPENDIHQCIIGTSGAVFYTWYPPYTGNNSFYTLEQQHHARSYGYVLVEVDDLDIRLTWIQRHTQDTAVPGVYGPAETWGYTVSPGPVILSPNGNENLVSDRPHEITWKTVEGASVDQVALRLSTDDGLTWQDLDYVENTGSYTWVVQAADSNQCLIHVSDAENRTVGDISDESFTIFSCQRHFQGDLNNDCYVDFSDLAILATDWLQCGNAWDPLCQPR